MCLIFLFFIESIMYLKDFDICMGGKQTTLALGEETLYIKGFHNFNYIFGNIYMGTNFYVKYCKTHL